jgi:hypothetical protein
MKYKCPVCGNFTIEQKFDICPICYWEYDPIDIKNPELISNSNKLSLYVARSNYCKYGISSLKYLNKLIK